MKTGEWIVRLLAEMRSKGRSGPGIACLEFGKGVQIALRFLAFKLCNPKGLEDTHRLRFSAEQEIADRTSAEILHSPGDHCTSADAGAELLVGSLEPRGSVDGVAIGRVFEEPAASEIPYDGRSCVHANSRNAQREATARAA